MYVPGEEAIEDRKGKKDEESELTFNARTSFMSCFFARRRLFRARTRIS